MKWKKYTIETRAEAVDFISEMLAENGIEGIEIEDSEPLTEQDYAEMFADILPEPPMGDGSAKVHFYMDEDETEEVRAERLEAIRSGLKEIAGFVDAGSCQIVEGETDEQDWRNNWKQYFHAFKVDDMLIHPTWEPDADRSGTRYQIAIDPGAAFGTGSHETTRLCLQHLGKAVHRHLSQSACQHEAHHGHKGACVDLMIQYSGNGIEGRRYLHGAEQRVQNAQRHRAVKFISVLFTAKIKELFQHLKHMPPPCPHP